MPCFRVVACCVLSGFVWSMCVVSWKWVTKQGRPYGINSRSAARYCGTPSDIWVLSTDQNNIRNQWFSRTWWIVHSISKVIRFFFKHKKAVLIFHAWTWNILNVDRKCFALYIPDLVNFRYRAPAGWMPKLGHLRKTHCETEIQMLYTNKLPASATTHSRPH